jgi:hypothetical protein
MPPENEAEEPLVEISEAQVDTIEAVANKLRSCRLMFLSGHAGPETMEIFGKCIDDLDAIVVELVEGAG